MRRETLTTFGSLKNDESGGAMLTLALLLTVAGLGVGSLILDSGRVLNSQSELQAFTDMAALAAAGELDGRPDAFVRANTAVASLLRDSQSWAIQDAILTADDVTLTFLSDLPASDLAAPTAFTNDPAEAAFVQVVTDPFTVSSFFVNVMTALSGGGGSNADIATAAIAGWTQYQCDISPVMFCVPDGMDAQTARGWLPGRQIRLKAQPFWGPGAFGLLDVNFDPDGPCGTPNTGANYYRCAVAVEESITQCFQKNGVNVRPGQAAGPSESGFNARMDIYTTNLKSKRNDPLFRPAPNVVKGIMPNGGNSCIGNNAVASNGAATPTGMPIEACLISETCAAGGGRFGAGQTLSAADRSAYVQSNYIDFGAANPVGDATSRYSVYLNEINNTPASENILPPLHDETGRNMCAAARSSDPERRVITAAAIDCSTLPPGNASDVPVLDFYRIFITNPAGFDPTAPGYSDNVSLWVEVIEHIDPFGGGSLSKGFVRDFVQLYR